LHCTGPSVFTAYSTAPVLHGQHLTPDLYSVSI